MQKGFKINHFILYGGLLIVGLFAFILTKSSPTEAAAGVNQTVNFQGRLLNSQGATVPDGFYNIEFKIYQDGDGQSVGNTTGSPSGSLKWTEGRLNTNSQGVRVVNGYLSVSLGSVTAFGSNIDWNQDTLWLSMNIGNTNTSCTPFTNCAPDGEMVPMQPMTSAPYALNSGKLGGLSSSQFVQIAQGLQTDASSVDMISLNKTGASGNLFDLQKNGSSVFLIANGGATTITTSNSNALLVRNSSGTGYLSVDTSGGSVKIGITGVTSADSTVNIADSSNGVQTVSIGSTNSTSTTTIRSGSGGITLNGDITVSANKNFTQSGTGTFSTGSGAVSINGDTTIAANKNFTQSGTGTFSTGSGTNTLNGNTTVAGTSTFTVNGGNSSLGANLDVTGSTALKKGTDFSTTGTTNNANFANASLIRLTGASAQTITGIANGRDGYVLTFINAGSQTAIFTNNDSNSSAANRITTGTSNNMLLPVGATLTLVYDSGASLWRTTATTNLQAAYNNSTSPQITLSSANGGLVVQDASSPIGADLFTVQTNGGATKYLNVTSSTVAISNNVTVTGTYNTNTFTSTALQFGGASGTISTSAGNLTIQAASTNSLMLDTAGAGTVSLAGANATNINVATSNIAHNINIGTGGTSTAQTIVIGSTGAAASSVTLNAGSSGGIILNGDTTHNGNLTISGTNAFVTGSGAVSLNGDTTIAANKNFTQNGTGTFTTGSGINTLNGDVSITANKNFTQNGTGTFTTGSGAVSINGDTTIASNKNFTQSGSGTFSTGSGTNTLNGNTTVAGTSTFAVNGGNTSLGARLDVTGSAALKKGTDFSTTGTTNNASFGDVSLIRLTGASAQTITGIANGRDGYILTLINAGNAAATLTNNDSNSSATNRIITGTGGNASLPAGASVTLVYDSTSAVWRAGSIGGGNLQTAYNNSTTSPQITLSSANGGLVVQDASTPIGADLFTVQNNGGATKYFNVTSSATSISGNLSVSGTYNTNTFNSTALTFGGASGTVSSAGNLTIQAGSTNSLLLDTGGAGTVAIGTANAATVNVATNNSAHAINIGTGGTSATQTIAIGSTGSVNSSVTINAGTTGGVNINGPTLINGSTTISGTNSFATGSGAVSLNGDTVIAANKNFTQNGTGTFSTGSGTNTLNGNTTISGSNTFTTGTGAVALNGDTVVASGKTFTANGAALFKSNTNSATAFQVQNTSSYNILAVDTSSNHLKVFDGAATQAYIDIYYDTSTTSAVIAASTGTTKIGNGTGPISLNAGSGAAVTISGHASSTWSLDSGDLTIDVTSGSTPTLNLGTGSQAKTISIGNGTSTTAVNVQCGTGTCGFGNNATDHSTTIGSTTGTSATAIRGGSGGVAITGNTTVTGTGTFQASGNSTTAFRVNNSSGSAILDVDTSNSRVGVGTSTPNEALQVNGAVNLGTTSNTNAGTIRWTGTDFEGYDGTQWKSMTTQYLSVNPSSSSRKNSDECVNSNGSGGCQSTGNTLQDDDELSFAVGANEVWNYRFVLSFTAGTTPDIRFSVTAPTATDCDFGFGDFEGARGEANTPCGTASQSVSGTAADEFVEIMGTLVNGATPGTVTVQWAQNTSSTTVVRVYTGSFLQANRILNAGSATLQAFVDDGNSFGASADLGTNDAFDLNLRTNGNTIATFSQANGAALFKNSTNNATAFQIQSSTSGKLFVADTQNTRIYVGDPASDATGVVLVADTSSSSSEPTGVNGAIYYSTGGRGGAGTSSSLAGKFRCYEGGIWKNCIGMRDIAERRWGYAAPQGTTSTAFNADGLFSSTILGAGAAGAVASANQAESNYVNYPTTASSGTKGGFGNTFSATATQTRWLPKLVTRVRVDSTAVTSSRYWVALASADLSGSDGTGSFIGLRYSTAAGDGSWQCASRDGTTTSVTSTGVTVTAGNYYDIIVDLTTSGTLVCSVAVNGGAYTTVTKTTNLPGTSTSLGLQQTVTTLTTAARTIGIAYSYLEFQ